MTFTKEELEDKVRVNAYLVDGLTDEYAALGRRLEIAEGHLLRAKAELYKFKFMNKEIE